MMKVFATGLMALAVVAMPAAPAVAAKKKKPEPVVAAPPAPSVRQGVELWRAGDYPAAVAMWQPFAAAGDKDALFNMGQAHKLGRVVAKDPVLARDYFRRAAMQGHLPAQANLGILLFQAGEKAEAMRWLKAAADKNEMRAQYVLGVALWNGDGAPRSLMLAYAYLARASAQGLPEATTALNTLTGQITPLDRANGWAVATSLAAGNGVPAAFAGGAGRVAVAEAFTAEQVIKPAPKPVEAAPKVAAPVAVAAAPVVQSPAVEVRPQAPAVSTVAIPAGNPAVAVVKPVPVVVEKVAPAVVPAPKPVVVAVEKPSPAVVAAPKTVVAAAEKPAPTVVQPAKPTAVAQVKPVVSEGSPVSPAVVKPAPVVVAAVAKPVPAVVKKPTGWRVQLGAFSKKALAEAAWTDVRTKDKKLVADRKPIFETDGGVTKLQLGPFADRSAARDACARIAFSGRACFVTAG